MKLRLLLATVLLVYLSCMAGVGARVKRVDVVYIGSIWDDLQHEIPHGALAVDTSSIKIGHTLTTPLFLEYFLQRMGLHSLLEELGFDFVISDTLVRDRAFFPVAKNMGYAIKNYGDIRFALVSSPADSMTLQDRIQLTLLEERSDIIWVIDRAMLAHAPSLIRFHVSERSLADTSISKITGATDPARLAKIRNFRVKVKGQLDRKIPVMGRLDEHLFSVIAGRESVDAIIYPPGLFTPIAAADSMTLAEIMRAVAFETRFRKAEIPGDEVIRLSNTGGYLRWGTTKPQTRVLVPDTVAGKYLFDYYY